MPIVILLKYQKIMKATNLESDFIFIFRLHSSRTCEVGLVNFDTNFNPRFSISEKFGRLGASKLRFCVRIQREFEISF